MISRGTRVVLVYGSSASDKEPTRFVYPLSSMFQSNVEFNNATDKFLIAFPEHEGPLTQLSTHVHKKRRMRKERSFLGLILTVANGRFTRIDDHITCFLSESNKAWLANASFCRLFGHHKTTFLNLLPKESLGSAISLVSLDTTGERGTIWHDLLALRCIELIHQPQIPVSLDTFSPALLGLFKKVLLFLSKEPTGMFEQYIRDFLFHRKGDGDQKADFSLLVNLVHTLNPNFLCHVSTQEKPEFMSSIEILQRFIDTALDFCSRFLRQKTLPYTKMLLSRFNRSHDPAKSLEFAMEALDLAEEFNVDYPEGKIPDFLFLNNLANAHTDGLESLRVLRKIYCRSSDRLTLDLARNRLSNVRDESDEVVLFWRNEIGRA